MMEHELWAYTTVCFVSPESERMLARFHWIYTEDDTSIEEIKDIEFSFKDLTPNMNQPSKKQQSVCWGLTVENQHSFLDDCC
jgi:hypothetical protein